jgi:hypothetical protein
MLIAVHFRDICQNVECIKREKRGIPTQHRNSKASCGIVVACSAGSQVCTAVCMNHSQQLTNVLRAVLETKDTYHLKRWVVVEIASMIGRLY